MLRESNFFKDEKFEIVIFGSLENGLFEKTQSDLDLTMIIDES